MDCVEKARCPSWFVSERQKGDSSEVEPWARPDAREGRLWQRDQKRRQHFLPYKRTRRYYRPRALTARAIESLFRPGARSFGDDNAGARPQSGLFLNSKRCVSQSVCIREKNWRSGVINNIPSWEMRDPLIGRTFNSEFKSRNIQSNFSKAHHIYFIEN